MADNTYSSRVHCHVSSFLHFRINEENDSLRFLFPFIHLHFFLYSAFFPLSSRFLGSILYTSPSWSFTLPSSRFLPLISLFFLSLVSCRLYFSSSFLQYVVFTLYIYTIFHFPFQNHFPLILLVCNFSNHHSLLQIFPSFQSYVISLKDLSVKPQYSKKLIHVTPMDHQTLHITARDKQKFFCCCCCAGKIIQQGIGFFNEGLGNPVEYITAYGGIASVRYIFFFQLQRFLMTNP